MFYNFIRGCLYPILFLLAIFSRKKRIFIKKRLFQNFSNLQEGSEYIWIHCSSVGEVNLCEGLIRKIRENYEARVLVSVFTDTGYATAQNRYSKDKNIDIVFFPMDDYFAIRKILKKINLKMLLIIETEIWPNLITECAKIGRVILINGRISNRSFNKYLMIKSLLKNLFKNISLFCMQSENDAERIIELGADCKKVYVMGNLKFDINFEIYSEAEREKFRETLNIGKRKVLVAGSTRAGEDEKLISVYKKLKNYILILVPRHIERVPLVERIIEDEKLKYIKFSDLDKNNPVDTNIILVDKMGILRELYSIADIAFVGGTLVDIGGHSLLEPLFYKKTPIFGPYLQNVKDISKEILDRKIGYRVTDENEFILAIENIEKNSSSDEKINNFFRSNSQVAEKIIEHIKRIF